MTSPSGSKRKLLILDACVLIDFVKADRSVIASFCSHIGPIHVISPVLAEVHDIENEDELTELGIIIIEPEIEDAFSAANSTGPASFEDKLCMLTAKRHGFVCVTNDTNLRKLCSQESVPTRWGLQLILDLHKLKGIPQSNAIHLAETIHRLNPKHITKKIIDTFTTLLSAQEKRK